MTKRTRRILFYSFIVVFILLSIVAVLIALGYGYDFVHNRIVKTGAFGVTTNIGASVYINDRLQGQTSFLGNSFTKNRLIPGEYTVRLERSNYISWQKRINIVAGAYTDFPSVILIPTDVKTDVILEGISALPGSQLVYKDWLFYINAKGFLSYLNIRSNSNTPIKEFNGTDGIKITANYKVTAFDQDNNEVIVSYGASSYLIDLDNSTTKALSNLPFKNTDNFYLKNSILYGLSNSQLMAYDTSTSTSKILLRKIRSFAIGNDSVAYIDNSIKNLHIYSLINNKDSAILTLPTGVIKISQFDQSNNIGYLILQSSNLSMFYKLDTDKLIKVSNYTNKFIISPSQNKLLYFTGNEISVLYLQDTSKQPYIIAGEQNLITRMSKTINNPDWYKDEEHILAEVGGTIVLIEIDGRGGRSSNNLYEAINFKYDIRSDTVYIIKNGSLLKTSF